MRDLNLSFSFGSLVKSKYKFDNSRQREKMLFEIAQFYKIIKFM